MPLMIISSSTFRERSKLVTLLPGNSSLYTLRQGICYTGRDGGSGSAVLARSRCAGQVGDLVESVEVSASGRTATLLPKPSRTGRGGRNPSLTKDASVGPSGLGNPNAPGPGVDTG